MSKSGYKNPPKHGQFQKGQSGNPKGRPKNEEKSEEFVMLMLRVLEEEISITESGKQKTITKKEALARSLISKSLNGDSKYTQLLMLLVRNELISAERVREERKIAKERINREPKDAIEAMNSYKEFIASLEY